MSGGLALRGPARAMARRAALPIVGAAVGLVAAGVVTAVVTPVYEATSSLMIQAASTEGAPVPDLTVAMNLTPTLARLAGSHEVALDIAQALHLPEDQVVGHVSATYEPGIQIVTITASSASAIRAAAIANNATTALARLYARLGLDKDSATTVAPLDLARAPGQPVFPRPWLNGALGGLVGLLAGLGVVSLRSRVDSHFRRLEDAEAELGLPALGALRRAPSRRVRSARRLYSKRDTARSIDATVAALSVLNRAGQRRRIVVTSAGQDDSATYVAALLAVGLRESYQPATVVEATPGLGVRGRHRPSALRRYFPQDADRTVPDILASLARPAEALTRGRRAELRVVTFDALCHHFDVEQPSAAMVGTLIDALPTGGEHVIVIAPPVRSGAGLSALAQLADVVLLVVSSDQLSKADASRAALLIQRVGAPLAGLLVLGSAAEQDGPAAWPWPQPEPRQPEPRQPGPALTGAGRSMLTDPAVELPPARQPTSVENNQGAP